MMNDPQIAYLLDSVDGYDETFHKLDWDLLEPFDDLLGFYDANRHLPDDYSQKAVYKWVKGEEDLKFPDYYHGFTCWILVSKRLREFLEEYGDPKDYQFLEPVFSKESLDCSHMGYKLLKIRNEVDALNKELSKFEVYTEGEAKGMIRCIDRYVLKSKSVNDLNYLFRLKGNTTSLCASPNLGAKLHEIGFLGLGLYCLETDHIEV